MHRHEGPLCKWTNQGSDSKESGEGALASKDPQPNLDYRAKTRATNRGQNPCIPRTSLKVNGSAQDPHLSGFYRSTYLCKSNIAIHICHIYRHALRTVYLVREIYYWNIPNDSNRLHETSRPFQSIGTFFANRIPLGIHPLDCNGRLRI
jgi:hypothetical protein